MQALLSSFGRLPDTAKQLECIQRYNITKLYFILQNCN